MSDDASDKLNFSLLSRGSLIVAWLLAVAAAIIYFTDARWLAVMTELFRSGLMAGVWMLSAGALGGFVLARMRVRCDAWQWIVSAIGLGFGLYSLLMLGLGLAGALNRFSVIGLLVVSWILAVIELRRRPRDDSLDTAMKQWLIAKADWEWLWMLTVPAVAIMILGAAMLPGWLWKPDDPHPYDVMTYHLQVPREWYELGRIVPLHHNVYSFFPFNVEIHYLGLMHLQGGAFEPMYTCQFLSVMMTAVFVATMAGYSGVTAGVIATLLPWVVMPASVCYVESGLLMFSGLAVVWMMCAIDGRARLLPSRAEVADESNGSAGASPSRFEWHPFVLAGIFCGLAAGVKLTALPMLAAAIGVGALVARAKFKGLAIFSLATLLVVSPWLIRNFAWSGNPVFPLAMKVLGKGHFSDKQVERFDRAHAAPQRQQGLGRFRAADAEIVRNWKYGYVLWPLAIAGGVMTWRRRSTQAALVALLIMLLVWIFATHLISRFFVIAIPVALVLMGKPAPNQKAWLSVRAVAAGLVLVFCLFGPQFVPLLERYLALGQRGIYGLHDLSFLDPEELEPWQDSGDVVYKIGDAQAYALPQPMNRIKYRTPFDVDDSKGDGLQAWLGEGVDRNKIWMLIDPQELMRLNRTYRTPIPEAANDRSEPFLIAPGGVVVPRPRTER